MGVADDRAKLLFGRYRVIAHRHSPFVRLAAYARDHFDFDQAARQCKLACPDRSPGRIGPLTKRSFTFMNVRVRSVAYVKNDASTGAFASSDNGCERVPIAWALYASELKRHSGRSQLITRSLSPASIC